ncbi:MAG: 16S rRNA (adenine(1518)-N(6)/adenine(1519)-N(6))-dimethyltransferase RsmA [bacterium]|nr:16S rRNA (adenine(1518)-N(6)/adenine(1519)-N(6))-dimethyltransferase RsmA [Mycoplasmatota bacterium]MDD6757474.1 16S rRNA (adenine(1518)-N(6)/adenine(1519)-N(6))-dimethyltransferase RsmA [bacterium]
MEHYDVTFKKKFGQNFLKRKVVVERIADVCSLTKDDLVIEVGPGGAILTQELAKRAGHVLAYEIDEDLKVELTNKLSEFSNVDILFQDFLNSSLEYDISRFSYSNLYFISNVPYYITTPIIMKIVNSNLNFKKICMMVQKEVGNRFCASPGSREYGSISVFLSYFYDVKKEFLVSRKEFVPEPNVDSVVISFTKKDVVLNLKDRDLFFKVVRDSFQFKRKNLRNNLKKYDLNIIRSVLQDYDYDLTVRAEQLSVEIFVAIANALAG